MLWERRRNERIEFVIANAFAKIITGDHTWPEHSVSIGE